MKLSIPDMACGGCLKGVTRAIASLDPAAHLASDLAAREITVKTGASEAAVLAGLERAGFPAHPR